MKKTDLIPAAIWIAMGGAVAGIAYHLKLGTLATPGPGLMPFLLGVLLVLFGLLIFLGSLPALKGKVRKEAEGMWAGVEFRKLGVVLGTLLGYILLLPKVGFVPMTFLLLLILFKVVGSQRWPWALISSGLTVVIAFFLFVILLNVELPAGLLR